MAIFWIASYPKSGDASARAFLANCLADGPAPVERNALSDFGFPDTNIRAYERAAATLRQPFGRGGSPIASRTIAYRSPGDPGEGPADRYGAHRARRQAFELRRFGRNGKASGFRERSKSQSRFFRSGKRAQWRETLSAAQAARPVEPLAPAMRAFGNLDANWRPLP